LRKSLSKTEEEAARAKRGFNKKSAENDMLVDELEKVRQSERRLRAKCRELTSELEMHQRRRLSPNTGGSGSSRAGSTERATSATRRGRDTSPRTGFQAPRPSSAPNSRERPPRFDPTAYHKEKERRTRERLNRLAAEKEKTIMNSRGHGTGTPPKSSAQRQRSAERQRAGSAERQRSAERSRGAGSRNASTERGRPGSRPGSAERQRTGSAERKRRSASPGNGSGSRGSSAERKRPGSRPGSAERERGNKAPSKSRPLAAKATNQRPSAGDIMSGKAPEAGKSETVDEISDIDARLNALQDFLATANKK